MATKREETSKTINLGWTEEAYSTAIDPGYSELVRGNYVFTVNRYINKEYVPLYFVAPLTNDLRSVSQYLNRTTAHNSRVVPTVLLTESSDTRTMNTMLNLHRTKKYSQLIPAMDYSMYRVRSGAAKTNPLKTQAGLVWDSIMQNMYYPVTAPLPATSGLNSALAAVKFMKHISGWTRANIQNKKVTTGKWATTQYALGRYFLAYMEGIREAGYNVAGNSVTTLNPIERDFGFVPLMSLMVKKENAQLVRAHMLAGAEMDSTLVELWVDKNLEDETSPHAIRVQYERAIRNPLVKAGVELRIFDNLGDQIWKRQALPVFKSIKASQAYGGQLVQQMLDSERKVRGVKLKVPAIPEVPAVKNQALEIDVNALFQMLEQH